MSVFLLILILSEVLLPNLTCASRVRRQATKVRISAIGDTIMLRFLEPHRETKLEGYILGYGSSLFSKQLIKLPDDGEPYETEIDAEPKYLVAVQPVNEEQVKKQCTGKESLEKPLHLVIGTVSPTSVMLSWATLLNTLSTETNLDDCTDDGDYTVRYREKEPKKIWNYQTCPTTDTIIDDLKPDTPYEFGVRAKLENINGAWSPSVTHNTAEMDAHKMLEPENLFQPEPPSTEEPQTFSPSVPVLHIVTESRPAPPLSTPEPSPTQRITDAKDRDVHKPQKPENLQRPEKPVTESPQTFPPSVPVLSSTIQSRPASLFRPRAPPPTQRIIQNTDEPLKSEIILVPEEPITEGPQAFSPSVPDMHSVTQSKPVSVLRHTAHSPTQKIIQDVHEPTQPVSRPRHKTPSTERPQSFSTSVAGTGSDAIRTSRPSEDSLFLTQTPTSAHTPMSNFETNDIFQTQYYTVSSLSLTTQQPLHTIKSKSQINKTKTVPSTVTAQHNVTQKQKTQLHKTIYPQTELSTTKFQTSTSTFQMTKTQFQEHTAKYPLTAVHAKPTSPQPYTIHSRTSIEEIQHSTTKGQFKMLEPITTQSQHHPSQTLSIMIQSQPHITDPKPTEMQKTPSKPTITQTQPHTSQPKAKQTQPHETQPQSTASQTSQPQPTTTHAPLQPRTFQAQPITTQSQLRMTQSQTITKIYQPGTTQTKINTTQAQPHTTQTEPHTTQTEPHTTQTEPHTTQAQPHTTQTQPHTTKTQSTTTQTQPHTTQTQHHTKKTQPTTTQTQPTTTQTQPITPQTPHTTKQTQPTTTQNQPTTTQTQPTTTQTQPTTTQTQPHRTKTQPTTTQTQPHTTKTQPTTTQTQPHTTKTQPTTTQTQPTTTQTQPHRTKTQPTTTQTQPHTTKTQPTTTQTQPTTTQTQPTTTQTQVYTTKTLPTTTQTQPHTIQTQPIKTYTKSTKQTVQAISNILHTTKFHQRPDHHPKKHSNTKTWQNDKTELTPKSKPKHPVGTPPEKSQGEKKPGNQKLPDSKMAPSQPLDGHLTKPVLVNGATNGNKGQEMSSTSVETTSAPTGIKRVSTVSVPNPIKLPPTPSNTTVKKAQGIKERGNKAKGNKTRIPKPSQNLSNGEKHKGQKSSKKKKPESTKNKENLNQVDKDEAIKTPTNLNLKNELPLQKPSLTTPPAEIYQKPTPTSAFNGDNSSVFSSAPVSEVDIMGKNRFVAPHVIYQINKPPKQPCSVTNSLSYFPDEENVVANISGPPKTPPTNVTVVTVEGCSSFVIIDWEKADNETTEYDVVSSENSPSGKIVSVVTTNQTHTAVENLKPESSYEFKVTPKNELGSGPSSESVTFNTESADPRVSEIRTGKNAIWSSFSFKADSYSECNGNQFVKRTWYRKFVGIQLCNSLRYKIYLSDTLKGKFYNIGDETGYGEDHCQFVDSYLDGQTGGSLSQYHLPLKQGYFRSMRQEPVKFGKIGGSTQINYVAWYECGVPIPGSW